jgi:signal transduction histidine kinase/CheY-like chemotaxis protein
MLHYCNTILFTKWCLVLSLLAGWQCLHAQRQETSAMQSELGRADSLISSYKNDSANVILDRLLVRLTLQNQLDSPFGLRVQLMKVAAFEHDKEDTTSIHLLLQVKERCQKKKLWDTYIKASLILAKLHESVDRKSKCLDNLQDARQAIAQHKVDSLYPQFALRMASYQRVLMNNPDSAVYYAREVLRTAPLHRQFFQEAWGHMILSFLRTTSQTERLRHFEAAATIFKKIDDPTSLSALMASLTRHYFLGKNYAKALIYNDSTIAFIHTSIASGNKMIASKHRAYKTRGDIYRQMGRYDSAFFYLKKGYDLEVSDLKLDQGLKVIEIDARYNDRKRLEKIAEQARVIREEKARRNLLIVFVFIVLLFATALAYFYHQLQKANKVMARQAIQLKELDAAKSRFFANISHELRTPLTLMLGPIKSLLKGNHSAEQQEKLLTIAKLSGQQLQQLINEILDLRKLEMGKMDVHAEPTLLSAFFNRQTSQFESLAKSKQIDFSNETTIPDDAVANIDREKCRQILYNLLSNALKFTPAGGWVKVSCLMQGGSLHLRVADSGPGIPPEDMPHVFDRYFQALPQGGGELGSPGGWGEAQGGTGIGLALCQEYAKLFGGNISVESTVGKGSVFSVEFPVMLADLSQLPQAGAISETIETEVAPQAFVATKPVATPEEPTSKPTILLVEDNPELQAYIRLILEEKYHVITAGNGREALDLLRDEERVTRDEQVTGFIPHPSPLIPDLILSDLMMPVMDGYQLLENLKSSDATRHIPAIMLTARAEAKDRLKALRIGVDDYLTKPFDEEELLLRIKNLLANHAERKEAVAEEQTAVGAKEISQTDLDWLESFETYVQGNFGNDALTVSFLAQEFAMSESTLLRQLKRLTGLSPQKYLMEMRLNEARQLLENRQYDSITMVASKVGYPDARSFSRTFKERFGKLPSEILSD